MRSPEVDAGRAREASPGYPARFGYDIPIVARALLLERQVVGKGVLKVLEGHVVRA